MTDKDMDFNLDVFEEVEEKPAVISTFKSDLLTLNINEIPMCDLGSLKLIKFKAEATEDYVAGSSFSLCRIPPSEVRLLFKLSWIDFSGISEGDFGYTKYRTRKREIMQRSVDGFSQAVFNMETVKVDSLEGIFFNFTSSHPGKKGDYIEGYLVYSKM